MAEVEAPEASRTKAISNKCRRALFLLNFTQRVFLHKTLQWNLVIKRSDITKPSYNKVILLVPALYISLFFYPDIMRNLL